MLKLFFCIYSECNFSECNCNNHALTCHFDEAVYVSSGNVTGGVCDNCQHNTQGQHCEYCRAFFFRDPDYDMQSDRACKMCDCELSGSLYDGICSSVADPVKKIEAGGCFCKENVRGARCDSCVEGTWNLTEANVLGCQNCTCNTLGTYNNLGCDMFDGKCTCKRLVEGDDCDQCVPETYGLSDDRDGCKPCDCDPGGSLDNNCDVISGQCKCRSFMQGRDCSQPRQFYFVPNLHIVSEAEGANTVSCNSLVVKANL